MMNVVKGMDQAMKAMDLEKVILIHIHIQPPQRTDRDVREAECLADYNPHRSQQSWIDSKHNSKT